MNTLRMRPRFELYAPGPPATHLDRLRRRLEAPDAPIQGGVYPGHAVLRMAPESEHFWSPHLSLDVERDGADTRIRGLFGPRPAVWSLFVFLYAALAFVGVMGSLLGLSQWMLGMDALALWSLPAALVLALGVYGIARVGRGLGGEQMEELRVFLDDVLAGQSPVTDRRPRPVAPSPSRPGSSHV